MEQLSFFSALHAKLTQGTSKPVADPSLAVPFTLERGRRKTLSVEVKPDQSILVKAPRWVSQAAIARWVWEKQDWIAKRKQELRSCQVYGYHQGEVHHFLGRAYTLDLHRQGLLKVEKGVLGVPAPGKETLEQWFYLYAKRFLPLRTRVLARRFPQPLPPFQVRVKRMRARWGSCSQRGFVNLNHRLIHFPRTCIDHVILHELCHFIFPDHSRRFYDLLRQVEPSHGEVKQTFARFNRDYVQGYHV